MNTKEHLTEQVLIIRSQCGDTRAFEQLAERYFGQVRYFVRCLRGRSVDNEDIIQDVWLQVFKGIRKLRTPEAFSAWLYRIVRNRVHKEGKAKSSFVPFDEKVISSIEDGNMQDFSTYDATRIHKCLETLSLEHREVLVLQFLHNMSYKEIAAVTGCSLGTVRSRIHYGKKMLKEKISKESIDE